MILNLDVLPLGVSRKQSFREGLREYQYVLLPGFTWLCLTLSYTVNANIYADDALLLKSFEDGNFNTYIREFLYWVPGRNLTIFFQYIFFGVTSTSISTFGLYHFFAQLLYVCTAGLVGLLTFKLTRSKFLAFIITSFFLFNPLNIQIINWALALPQHVIPTLFSIVTVYLLFKPNSQKNEILIMCGLVIMIFTYDQSAALAFFVILYCLIPSKSRFFVINFKSSLLFKIFSFALIFSYFSVSYFGRRTLGYKSTLSENSLDLLQKNLIYRPIHNISQFTEIILGKYAGVASLFASISLLAILILCRRLILAQLKQQDVNKIKLCLFFFILSFVSFLPAALWYPNLRHFFLPTALMMICIGVFINDFNLIRNWRSHLLQNLILVLTFLLVAQLQVKGLSDWQDRDDIRKNFYLELSEKMKEYPDQSNFFIDDSSAPVNDLFYSEWMPSAYRYYNNFSSASQVRIHQLSKLESLQTCTTSNMDGSLFIEITFSPSNENYFSYSLKPLKEICT
jgi:hypothetical protein